MKKQTNFDIYNINSEWLAKWLCLRIELPCAYMDYRYVFLALLSNLFHAEHGFYLLGAFDSSVHISEEATNARTAVPFAIVTSTVISCILGWGECIMTENYLVLELTEALSH